MVSARAQLAKDEATLGVGEGLARGALEVDGDVGQRLAGAALADGAAEGGTYTGDGGATVIASFWPFGDQVGAPLMPWYWATTRRSALPRSCT